jgi:hypothetical protein
VFGGLFNLHYFTYKWRNLIGADYLLSQHQLLSFDGAIRVAD